MERENRMAPNELDDRLAATAKRLERELGGDLAMLAVYGSAARGEYDPQRSDINLLVVLERADAGTLRRVATALEGARAWFRCAPFVLVRDELASAADVFPIKFLDIRRTHRLLAGTDLLATVVVRPCDLRLACETDVRNVILKLRRALVVDGPDVRALTATLRRFVPQVLGALGVMMSLTGVEPPASRDALLEVAATRFGFDAGPLREALAASRQRDPTWPRMEKAYDDLLRELDTICRAADRLPEGPS